MKILIIENELPNARRLKRLLTAINPDWEIDGPLSSLSEMSAYFALSAAPDIVFADIRLSDGQVFDALHLVPPMSQIIFTTAYSEHALRAFDYNSVHYLLKPIDPEELEKAIEKAMDLRSARTLQPRRRFLIRHRDELYPVNIDDVAFIRHDTTGVNVVTFDGKVHPIDSNIETCQEQLDGASFFRASRRYLVNVRAIEKLTDAWNGKMRLHIHGHPLEEVTVSRDRVRTLRRWMEM